LNAPIAARNYYFTACLFRHFYKIIPFPSHINTHHSDFRLQNSIDYPQAQCTACSGSISIDSSQLPDCAHFTHYSQFGVLNRLGRFGSRSLFSWDSNHNERTVRNGKPDRKQRTVMSPNDILCECRLANGGNAGDCYEHRWTDVC
jgi:hypothetical protein